ncbi:hypothetical protein GGR51DRAFT_142656 [Nemania sp. FL0031]|nr:hypothetical protein GGR51DRAFT_142656 [Nemania sp. FL0031]
MSTCASCAMAQTESEPHPINLMEINTADYQDIVGRNIQLEKLKALLTRKFKDDYEIHMIHNIYSVRAPERLSQNEIESCKRNRSNP